MSIRRLLVVILIAALLGSGIPNPPKAHAGNTGVIIAVGVVGWFGLVILATWLVRRNSDSGFNQSSVSPLVSDGRRFLIEPREKPRVRVGHDCAPTADGPSLVCW
jgi:ABC-type dipeptide/oligopeptide/nickel transport system permease subunit